MHQAQSHYQTRLDPFNTEGTWISIDWNGFPNVSVQENLLSNPTFTLWEDLHEH